MTKKKVMLVFGTRPEAIKMAPVFQALKGRADAFDVLCCVTAQHRQMLDSVLETFDIRPDIDLDVMRPDQDLYSVTAAVILGLRDVLTQHKPDVVLVHGDTTTTAATSIASFYAGVPVGHVEAGLRTHDLAAPFPEEFNRKMTSIVARYHFALTEISRNNLIAENVAADQVHVTGNTVIDALQFVVSRLNNDLERSAAVDAELSAELPFPWRTTRFVLITGHRRENFGGGFLQICRSLQILSDAYPDTHFVYPVHLNPNVKAPVHEHLSGRTNVHLIPPLTYEPFVRLLSHCYLVLTDSGGIQEEAPGLGKPVLVMRDRTERPEAVTAGTVRLVGADCDKIVGHVCELLDNEESYAEMSKAHNPYGDGQASRRIIDILEIGE